ncbi:MAG TPA: A24 family peptidase [Phycisphaerae bacterium]|nr:A24 family peptidase [Phycisphaerae bacterium]
MNLATMILYGVFFTLVGACVGSFLNVVIWRLPHRGREVKYLGKTGPMTLSWPPSHCPMCDAPIRWYQNVPVLSYILLHGKCAKCRVPIPIRYPLVELATMMLWGGMYLAYFVGHWQMVPPKWVHGAGVAVLDLDWPVYVWHCLFCSALLAAAAIDADLFIIPLAVIWFVGVLGIAGSLLIGTPLARADYALVPWLVEKGWWLGKPILGAVGGLGLANVLLLTKVLPRSYPWELEVKEEEPGEEAKEEAMPPPPKLSRFGASVIAALIIVAIIVGLWVCGMFNAATVAGMSGAILIFLIGVLPRDEGQVDATDEVVEEIQEGNVRFEIMKEVLFLAIPAAAAALLYFLPFELPQVPWMARLLGSLLGLLAGGGVVWLIRIGGTLAFNRQAMGLGDVHLMAAVGTVMGAPLVLFAFAFSCVPALVWGLFLKIQKKPNVLPLGPWLAVASMLTLLVGYPIISMYLSLF